MRDIKYKGWDTANKVMIEWDVLKYAYELSDIFELNPHRIVIPLAYTGLKDKNGKEIYEGDIVKIHRFTQELGENLGVREGEKEFIASIKLKPYGGVTLCIGDVEEGYLWEYENGFHEESVEVIGSIHENPELLEAK